jgi:hypothetical protein
MRIKQLNGPVRLATVAKRPFTHRPVHSVCKVPNAGVRQGCQ